MAGSPYENATTIGARMEELKLVGVAPGGDALELCSPDEARFVLPVDEALRTAVRHVALRQAAQQSHTGAASGAVMSAREVQALVRSGATREEAAALAGWTEEKVARFETPILAEREYVASSAQRAVLRGRMSTGVVATLGARVEERLTARSARSSAEWDAMRREGSPWVVRLTFTAGGREREALWQFDPHEGSIEALDDEARWLSEDDTAVESLIGARPAPSAPALPYAAQAHPSHPRPELHEELQELSAHHPALRQARQAAREQAESLTPENGDAETFDLMSAIRERSEAGRRSRSRHRSEPGGHDGREGGPAQDELPVGDLMRLDEHDDSASSDEITLALPQHRPEPAAAPESTNPPSAEPAEPTRPAAAARGAKRRKARPAVPRWDDIVFGGGSGE